MNKKFSILVVLTLVVAIFSAGCDSVQDTVKDAADAASDILSSDAIKAKDGVAEGRVGDLFATAFFDFSIDSVEFPETYHEYSPTEGMQLIDVTLTIKNTFGNPLPMNNYDFAALWHDKGNNDEDVSYPLDTFADYEEVFPVEYELERGEEKTMHYIYEVPADSAEFSVAYLEYYEDETQGDAFYAFFEK